MAPSSSKPLVGSSSKGKAPISSGSSRPKRACREGRQANYHEDSDTSGSSDENEIVGSSSRQADNVSVAESSPRHAWDMPRENANVLVNVYFEVATNMVVLHRQTVEQWVADLDSGEVVAESVNGYKRAILFMIFATAMGYNIRQDGREEDADGPIG